MLTNRKLQQAVHLALGVASGALTVAYAPMAVAQEAASHPVEEVTITGSRIKRADLDSASPVTVIDHDSLVTTGITDIGNLIQRIPSMSGSPIGTTTNNGGNGSVQIDLRGMGVDRTVTLINGRRTVDGGDYQTIPATMIERVEILKDGASAVYGADAVAGVVNIITRKDFEGLDVDIETADYFNIDDGAQNSIGMIAGKAFDGGNFVFGAEYVDQKQAYQSDTPWDFFQNSYYIYPEGCENQVAAPYDGTPTGGCYPLGSSRIPEGYLRFSADGDFAHDPVYMNPGNGLVAYDGHTYNYAPVNYIQTPYKRTNLFAEANFDITDNVHFNTSVRANFRQSAQELAPLPYDSGTDPGYAGVYNPGDTTGDGIDDPFAYNGVSEQNYYLVKYANAAGLPIIPVSNARRRVVESRRRFTQDITQYQAVMDFSGTVATDVDWDVYYNKGYRSRRDQDFGQWSGPRLQYALGPSADLNGDGQPECYTDLSDPTSLVQGCVPLNLFGGAGTITQAQLDYVGVNLVDTFLTTQDEFGASVTGSAFKLPGGNFGWAVGYGYRGDDLEYSPDSAKQQDAVTGNTGAGTNGNLYSNSLFFELLAPVYDNGSQSLDLKGGYRYDKYNVFSAESTYQFGVEFQAVPGLKLRGTYGTVFRAPTISDLYAGQVDSFPQYNDPCIPPAGDPLPPGCAQLGVQTDSQVLARVGGNPDLGPEKGDTLTAGLVWVPDFADGRLSTTVDYWKIKLDDGISSLGVQFILDDCYQRQVASSCALITRRADYSVASILDGELNVAKQGAKGVDTEVRYTFDTKAGQFEAAVLWSHLIERTKTAYAGAAQEDLSGRYTDPTAEDGGAYADDKANFSLKWYWNNLLIGYQGEYISSLDADTFCNCGPGAAANNGVYIQKIDSQLYHDLLASYEFGTGTKISAGIINVTDEAPPYIEIGFNATTDPSTYRMFGRGYYLRLSQSFK